MFVFMKKIVCLDLTLACLSSCTGALPDPTDGVSIHCLQLDKNVYFILRLPIINAIRCGVMIGVEYKFYFINSTNWNLSLTC